MHIEVGPNATNWTAAALATQEGFLAAWFEKSPSADGMVAYFGRARSGGPAGERLKLGLDGRAEYGRLAITPADAGTAVLVSSLRKASDLDIEMYTVVRLLDRRGRVVRGPVTLNHEPQSSATVDFDVRRLADGDLVVAWLQGRDREERIAVRRLSAQGKLLGPVISLSGEPSIVQHQPRIGVGTAGAFAISERFRVSLLDDEMRVIATVRPVPEGMGASASRLRVVGGCTSRQAYLATWVDLRDQIALQGRWIDASGLVADEVQAFPSKSWLDENRAVPAADLSFQEVTLTPGCKSLFLLGTHEAEGQTRLLARLYDVQSGHPQGEFLQLAGPIWVGQPRVLEARADAVVVGWVESAEPSAPGRFTVLTLPWTSLQEGPQADH